MPIKDISVKGADFLDELRKEVATLPDKTYAVRSSTTAEDSPEYSFAGQFQTLINISGAENFLKAIRLYGNQLHY